jgi:bifunctional DNA-binding transcriptional regulator/antitoxin component of YhaV-PrlF toxin-antitoxin module
MSLSKEFTLRVRKKGIIILPKALRMATGIDEESCVVAEVREDGLLLKPLKPLTVKIDPEVVEKILSEKSKLKRRSILRYLESYVVDTSILVAYIVENEPGRNKVIELFKKAFKNHVELYITYQTLSETIYIAYKIYSIAVKRNLTEEL